MADQTEPLGETPSQTAGPYVHIGLAPSAAGFDIYDQALGEQIAGPGTPGTRIHVVGHVWDGNGDPVTDVLIEVWQADACGLYSGTGANTAPDFKGWGRAISDFQTGLWSFDTIKPGAVASPDGQITAPHLSLWIVARGINIGLSTRMYFADEAKANQTDPVLMQIDPSRRGTLLGVKQQGSDTYHFDIRLQGEEETVFFDI